MGPSGVGKTTLLRILMGLTDIDGGYISDLSKVKKSAVFQEDRLCEDFTGLANVALVLKKNESKEKAKNELLAVNIPEDEWKKQVSEYSGGMKRRVAIVRCMISDSDLIFMDEPLRGLDEDTKEMVVQYINRKRNGRTLVMVTHDKEDIQRFNGELRQLPSLK